MGMMVRDMSKRAKAPGYVGTIRGRDLRWNHYVTQPSFSCSVRKSASASHV